MSVVNGGMSNTQAQFTQTPATGAFAGTTVNIPATRLQANFRNGTGADAVDGVSPITLTLVASTPQTIDLTTLTDAFGVSLTVAHIAYLAIKVVAADGAYCTVGDAVTNEWDAILSAAGTMKIYPGSTANDGFVIFTAPNTTGYPVDSTHKALKFDPGSNAMTVYVLIGTRSV